MQHTVLNFLSPALIPELGSNIATGPARYRQKVLITVAAVRAFPDELSALIFYDPDLSVIATLFALVTLCI